jgi:hypothetical protein
MPQDRMTVRLSPLCGGAYTHVKIEGVLPTALPKRELRRLAQALAFWNGYPVACALSAEGQAIGWCGWWLDHLALIPAHHLELQCVRATAAAGMSDEPR